MKFASIFLTAICFLTSGISGFSYEKPCKAVSNETQSPNYMYLGPEFLSFSLNSNFKGSEAHGTRPFWGLRFGYEYLKPQALYAGVEILATNARHNFSISNETLTYNGQGGAGFGNIQARFGYSLLKRSHLISPYLGLGVYALSKKGHNGYEESMGYISGGARARFEYMSKYFVGINAEIFRTLSNKQTITLESITLTNHTNRWGGSLGLPLSMQLGTHWDMKLTPYFLKLLFGDKQNIFGTSLLISYRF